MVMRLTFFPSELLRQLSLMQPMPVTSPDAKCRVESKRQEVKRMKGAEEMNTKEVDRLIEWLIAHGHSYEEAHECIKYIAATSKP